MLSAVDKQILVDGSSAHVDRGVVVGDDVIADGSATEVDCAAALHIQIEGDVAAADVDRAGVDRKQLASKSRGSPTAAVAHIDDAAVMNFQCFHIGTRDNADGGTGGVDAVNIVVKVGVADDGSSRGGIGLVASKVVSFGKKDYPGRGRQGPP